MCEGENGGEILTQYDAFTNEYHILDFETIGGGYRWLLAGNLKSEELNARGLAYT